MYAVVNIAGQQFKVEKDQKIYVHRLPNKEGEKVTFDEVLLVDDKGKVDVGAPVVEGASVTAKVVQHLKGDKVIVFKKKRRKGYQKSNGHRQFLSQLSIEGITIGGTKTKAKAAPKKDEAEKSEAEPKAAAKKPATKKTTAKAKPAAETKKADAKPKKSDDKKTKED